MKELKKINWLLDSARLGIAFDLTNYLNDLVDAIEELQEMAKKPLYQVNISPEDGKPSYTIAELRDKWKQCPETHSDPINDFLDWLEKGEE